MDLSVIIPTRGRPAKLGACLAALGRQDLEPERFEVLVGIDGEDQGEALSLARNAFGHARVVVYEFSRRGYTAVRNGLIPHARGRVLLSTNDDVVPEAGFCRAHVEAHAERERLGKGPAVVVGDSPWVVHQPDRLFDRLVRETSMIFFYDQMTGPGARPGATDPEHDWGFRHAFGLNVSYPMALVRAVGGYAQFPVTYGYEDVEIAFRLNQRFGTPVLFRPAARAPHDHRHEPAQYLERERVLGRAAWGFARASPECSLALFGRDITAREELAYCREFVDHEQGAVERLRAPFARLADLPATAVEGPFARDLVQLIYQQHLPLKRWEWRRGLLEEAGAGGMGGAGGA